MAELILKVQYVHSVPTVKKKALLAEEENK